MQHDLFKPVSRDERQAQALKAWIKAKGHGTIVGATGFGIHNKKFIIIRLVYI
jgi:superfamily II DNA or RNA helicase